MSKLRLLAIIGGIAVLAGIVLLGTWLTKERPASTGTETAVAALDTPASSATSTPTMTARPTLTPTPTATPGRGTRALPTRTPQSASAATATPDSARSRGSGENSEATDTAAASTSTPTSEAADGATPVSEGEAATPETAATDTPPATVEATGPNLLVNGDFTNGFNGWNMANGLWLMHDISGSECAARNPGWPVYMAEMDIDNCLDCNKWEVGDEDWLWQDVSAPSHSRAIITVTEAHHMHSGDAEVRLYGSNDGGNWELLWKRVGPEAPFGAGKYCETPPSYSYVIEGSYPYYRVEIYGRMNEDGDGWLIGPVVLQVD